MNPFDVVLSDGTIYWGDWKNKKRHGCLPCRRRQEERRETGRRIAWCMLHMHSCVDMYFCFVNTRVDTETLFNWIIIVWRSKSWCLCCDPGRWPISNKVIGTTADSSVQTKFCAYVCGWIRQRRWDDLYWGWFERWKGGTVEMTPPSDPPIKRFFDLLWHSP